MLLNPDHAKGQAGNNFRFLSEPWSIALRLDFDLKGRDPTARSEGPVLASGKSLVQA
jgi:hypothetical protein